MSTAYAEVVDTQQPHSIHVSGQGRVLVRPDKANLSLAVEVHTKTAKAAREQAAKTMLAVIDAIKVLGIAEKDIQTSYVSLSPEYGEGSKIIGYQLNNQLIVCVRDVDKVGSVIDSAVQAGGNNTRIQSLNFTVENSAQGFVQAREKAYEDALAKAQQYAKLAGQSLGKAMHITEGSGLSPAPAAFYSLDMESTRTKSSMAIETPVQAGEQEVTINVDVVFTLEN